MLNARDFINEILSNVSDLSDKIYIDLQTDEESFDTAEFDINASNGYLQITVKDVDNFLLIDKHEHARLISRIEELEEALEELK